MTIDEIIRRVAVQPLNGALGPETVQAARNLVDHPIRAAAGDGVLRPITIQEIVDRALRGPQ